MARDVWQKIRPVLPTKNINKNFVIPAFSVECGEVHTCLRLFSDGTNQGYIDHILLAASDLTAALTIEAWVKLDSYPISTSSSDGYGCIFERSDANILVVVYVNELGIVNFDIKKGGINISILSSVPIPTGMWTHVSCSWDGTTMKIYINGVLVGSGALAAPADGFTAAARHHFMGLSTRVVGSDNYKQFKGYIDDVRVWDVGRTQDEILNSYLTPRNKTVGDNIDDDLVHYYKIQEGDGNTTEDSITGEDASILLAVNHYSWITDDGFPYRYGASFICNLMTVEVGTPCSIKFPINGPDDPNHGLFVRYQDTNGDWQRRRLYDSGESYDNVDIHPFLCPGVYNGERLSETFYIEVWNVDGQETADLEEEISVNISITSAPTAGNDHTQLTAATPTSSTVLAFSNEPLVNPMVPDTTQVYT